MKLGIGVFTKKKIVAMELEFHENRFNDSHTLHNGVNELTD